MKCNQQLSTGRIDSLQALRVLAFLGIFFLHAQFFVSWAQLGVSVFLVMSGFLMTYRYENVELDISLKSNIRFSLGKIKKLYPLHIITMICALVIRIVFVIYDGVRIKAFLTLIGEIFLNITLLQTWVPYYSVNISLNGVAWYLSVTMFLYFVFPWINRIVAKSTIIKLCLISGIILIIQLLSCMPFIQILGIDSPVYEWYMYCFPVFRLGDFFIGCVLKRLYFESDLGNWGVITGTICEITATLVTVWVYMWLKKEQDNIFLLSLHNLTTIFIPISVIWIMLFIINKGLITKMLTNRFTIYIGNLSSYAFLIHYVVTQFTKGTLIVLRVNVEGWRRGMLVLLELVISLMLSALYKKVHEKGEGAVLPQR